MGGMRPRKDGRRDDIMCNKWGFGGNAPSKLRPVLKARGVSMRATRAGGTAKSLSIIYVSPPALGEKLSQIFMSALYQQLS